MFFFKGNRVIITLLQTNGFMNCFRFVQHYAKAFISTLSILMVLQQEELVFVFVFFLSENMSVLENSSRDKFFLVY